MLLFCKANQTVSLRNSLFFLTKIISRRLRWWTQIMQVGLCFCFLQQIKQFLC